MTLMKIKNGVKKYIQDNVEVRAFDRDKEFFAGVNPFAMIRQTARRNNAMNMRVI